MTEAASKLSLTIPASGPAAGESRPQLRRSIRRLGDFSRTVEFALEQFNARYGVALRAAPRPLTRAFLEWVREFNEQRRVADRDRRDFSHFAAGLMLMSFIRNRPVELASSRPPRADPGRPEERLVDFWPEGVFYFEYCITVLDKVLAEQSLEGIHLSPQALELRSWQSFRENVAADPGLAVPFLDLFLDGDPTWDFPTVARFRTALRGTLLSADRRLSGNAAPGA